MPPEVLARCAPAPQAVFGALARAIRPQPRLSVADWAGHYREVAPESGSRNPGRWDNARTPYLVEVMAALGPDDPAEDVVFVASAQVGKSEVGVNFFGWVVDQDPGPMMIVLPGHDEMKKYTRIKLQPTIDATPRLRSKVLESASRAEQGSTGSHKRFRGGFAQVTFAGSSKNLQMISARYTIGEEVSEWPAVAGERGDPVEQLKTRTNIYERDRKRLWVSTPAIAGTCRISADYERSDRRRFFVPCPDCGAFQVLAWGNLKWQSDTWPHRAWFGCPACGTAIDHTAKEAMLAAGRWVATAGGDAPPEVIPAGEIGAWADRPPRGRLRGFHLWQAYSPFTSWDSIVAEFLRSRGGHERMRVFTQQVLGEAWEDRGDAPEAEKLLAARLGRDEFRLGRPPHGPVVATGAVDVQGDRLEWAVWGWSEGMTRWLIDRGVIAGDPLAEETWRKLAQLMATCSWRPGGGTGPGAAEPAGPALAVDAWAIDSGYASHAVYAFVRGRPGCFAVDGRHGRTEPMIGTPKRVDVKWNGKRVPRGAAIWPVGTFALKSDHYHAIRAAIAGPDDTGRWAAGAMMLPGDIDLAYAEQLTAEHLVEKELKSGVIARVWQKLQGRPNEALDIACYARAMAAHLKLDRLTPEGWARLRAERLGPQAQRSLFDAAAPVRDDAPAAGAAAGGDPGGRDGRPADGAGPTGGNTPAAPRNPAAARPWVGARPGKWL